MPTEWIVPRGALRRMTADFVQRRRRELVERARAHGFLTADQAVACLGGTADLASLLSAAQLSDLHAELIAGDAQSLESRLKPGTPFGEYRIVREVGRGAMGVVYEAEHPVLKRRMALKVLSPGITLHRRGPERFRKEARLLARLDHPNIVRVHDAGQIQGSHYIAMEFIEGRGLRAMITEARVDLRITVARVRDIAGALHAAHQAGIVHRDVKPANILVEAGGRVVLTDFGLAHSLGSKHATRTGTLLGTPFYMPPEQARGEISKVNAVSDVYSLGATLYHLVTGSPPFASVMTPTVLYDILSREPEPPSQFNPGVDAHLEAIILRCLEKEPGLRYPDADALAQDLQRWLDGKAIQVADVPRVERARRWMFRHRRGLTVSVVAVLLTAVAGVAMVAAIRDERDRERDRRHTDVATLEARYNADLRRARELREQRETELAAVREGTAKEIQDLRLAYEHQLTLLREELRTKDQQYRQDRIDAIVNNRLADLRARRGMAEQVAQTALDERLMRMNPEGAHQSLKQARILFEEVARPAVVDDDLLAILRAVPDYVASMDVADWLDRIDDGIAALRARDAWADWVLGRDHARVARSLQDVIADRPKAARPRFLRALLDLRAERLDTADSLLQAYRKEWPDDPAAVLAVAELRLMQGRRADASALVTQGIAALNRRSPDLWLVRGLISLSEGKHAQALDEFERLMFDPDNAFSFDLVAGRAMCLNALGRHQEVETLLRVYVAALQRDEFRVSRVLAGLSSGRTWPLFQVHLQHSRALLQLGRKDDALKSARHAERIKPADPDLRSLLKSLGAE